MFPALLEREVNREGVAMPVVPIRVMRVRVRAMTVGSVRLVIFSVTGIITVMTPVVRTGMTVGAMMIVRLITGTVMPAI